MLVARWAITGDFVLSFFHFPLIQQVKIVRNLLILRNIDLLERQNKMKVAETIHKIDKSSRK